MIWFSSILQSYVHKMMQTSTSHNPVSLVSYLGTSCRFLVQHEEELQVLKSLKSYRIRLHQAVSDKNPITTLIEILFPSRSLCGHSLSAVEYTFSTESRYTQLKSKQQLGRILTCLQNLSVSFQLCLKSLCLSKTHTPFLDFSEGLDSRTFFRFILQ